MNAIAIVVVGPVALDQRARVAGALITDVDTGPNVVAGGIINDLVAQGEGLERNAGSLGFAGVVGLQPVVAGVLQVDPPFIATQVVAAHQGLVGEVQGDPFAVRKAGDVVDDLVAAEGAVAG